MGNCINCGKNITLKAGELNCPSCGKSPYVCWYCKSDITGETKECSMCHFFICPKCKRCGSDCKMPELLIKTKKTRDRREVINIVVESITAPKRKFCHKDVSISYAHNKLRNMALRMKGVLIKDFNDKEKFQERFEKIIKMQIGKTWTINKERDRGQYGYELREVSNLAVCIGKAKKKRIEKKNKKGKVISYVEIYERVEEDPCEYMNWDKLVAYYCSSCKLTYDTQGNCKECGQMLEMRKSRINFCSKPRGQFVERGV